MSKRNFASVLVGCPSSWRSSGKSTIGLRWRSRGSATIAPLVVAGMTIACLSAPVRAQTTNVATTPTTTTSQGANSATNAGDIGEITVTAQRREEALSKVPESVSAFNSDTLKTQVIESEQDLAALVPGLVIKQGQNQNQVSFTLRGQTLDPFSGASPAVLTYLNEVPFNGGNSATEYYDFSSLQVLKGPQGTLFGRNATGGAVLYSSALPGNEYGASFTMRTGERDLSEFEAALDLPLIPDTLLVRLAGEYKEQNGYVHNLLAGGTLGDIDTKSARATIVWMPADKIKNTTVFEYSTFGGTEAASELYSYNKLGQTNNGFALTSTLDAIYGEGLVPGLGNGPPGKGTFPGAVAGYLAYQKLNPYDIYLEYNLPHAAYNYFASNTTTFDINSSMTLKNIFGYQSSYSKTPGILSGAPFAALDLYNRTGAFTGPPGGEVFRNNSYSDEIQLQGTATDSFKYIAGVFYDRAANNTGIPIIVGGDLATPLGQALYHTHGTDDSRALYAQGTYDFSRWVNGLSFTAGGRYTWDTVGMSNYADDVFSAGYPYQSKTQNAPSWNANLQYQFTSQMQVYFAQRGSFRAGGFNGAVEPYDNKNYFSNEYTHDFEIGFKFAGRVAGRPTHFNIAAYDQYVTNAQHAIYAVVDGAPSAFTVNVPQAIIKGFETDADIEATDWLRLGIAAANTEAKYSKNLVNLSNLTGTPGYVVPFDSYPDAPRWSGSVYADVTLPVPSEVGDMHLRTDVFGQTYSYFSSNNYSITPGTQLPGYATVALRLSLNHIRGSNVSAAVFAKNLFDKVYYESGYTEGASSGLNTAIVGEPRTIAAEISAQF
jgi:iron complex outermembrane recepter protein